MTDFPEDERIRPALLKALRGMRYGTVEIVVHDGRVVQVERREKVRIEVVERPPDSRGPQQHDDRSGRAGGGTPVETGE